MAALTDVAWMARNYSRDFGTYFEQEFVQPIGSVMELEHPLVQPTSGTVIDNSSGDALTEVALNARGGLLKVRNPASYDQGLFVSGMYHQWFLDEDFCGFANVMVQEHLHNRP